MISGRSLSERSKVLDELVPHTEAVHLQDSLQALVAMPEAERNEAIDRVIEALKKKEKEERRKQQEMEAEQKSAIGIIASIKEVGIECGQKKKSINLIISGFLFVGKN